MSKVNTDDFLASNKFKLILLAGMVLQNTATVLVGRYTQSGIRVEDRYVVNHLIVISEFGKIFLSCAFEAYSSNEGLWKSIQEHILDTPFDALKIMIPALLYLVQNTLLYVALANLTAPLFQVTYQSKLVTTAAVSVIMLNRKYSSQQWFCLVALSMGVAIVVLDKQGTKEDETAKEEQSMVVGLMAVSIACLSSALAGVYFEKVVKTSTSVAKPKVVSVWMRNIQLAFFTIIIALIQGMMLKENPDASSTAYFHGFTFWPIVLICLQAGGGLLVAAVIKYADNVLKGLATGVSVCFGSAVSAVLFQTTLSSQFVTGSVIILVSVFLFSNPIKKKEPEIPK